MKLVTFSDIQSLKIDPKVCVEWARNGFLIKPKCDLPAKISQKLPKDIFVNTMPCMIPDIGLGGVKVVSRYPSREPSLVSVMLVYDLISGNFRALMDANWITAMRTGAVAALAVHTFAKHNFSTIGIIGLGNTARATLACLAPMFSANIKVKLLKYKNQAELFIERFKSLPNVTFEIVETAEDAIKNSDVVISCLTAANEIMGKDDWFSEGVLVVPVHTRGFQNCDLFFDKVFADDTGHVKTFKYFDFFKNYTEFDRVLRGEEPGRTNDTERILSYNIGISLHDVYFAGKILSLIENNDNFLTINLDAPNDKFWI